MALVLKSLDAVSVATVGSVISFDKPRQVTAQVITTGGPSISVDVELSIDGVNFHAYDNASSDGHYWQNPFVMAARAHLTSISGGTSPTVTVWLTGSD